MSTKTSTSASTASESASKRRTKAASSAPEAAAVQVAAAPAAPIPVVVPVAAAPSESKGSKRKAPEKETKEPVAKESKRSAGSSKATKADEKAATAAAPAASTPSAEVTSEPPAKKPRKAPAPKAEGESKSSSRKKKAAAAPSSEASPAVADEAKEEEDCVEDGNPCIGRYLRALLKREFADSTISKDAIHQVQRYVYQFGLHFLVAVKRHLESAKKNTLMMHDMPTCLQRSLSRSSLYQDFSNAMTAALTLYYASYQNAEQSSSVPAADTAADASIEEKRKQMWAARAGLSIPPTRTKEFAKKYLAKFRFSQNSITGLTALFEVLAQRIFKLSYEKAQEVSRKRISQLDVQTALKGDNELSWLLIEPVVPLV